MKGSESEEGTQMHNVQTNRFNGARQNESRQAVFQKPGNHNKYGTKKRKARE